MTGRKHTDWNQEPDGPTEIAVPYDDLDTEGHGILPNPAKLGRDREFAAKMIADSEQTDGLGPVQDAERA
jgi:hypothetical protein